MEHAPIDDPTRNRLEQVGMGNAPEGVREVGVHHVRMAAKQQLLHLDHRLLSVSPGTVGIEFRWKVGLEDRPRVKARGIAAVMQTRSRKVEMPSGLSLPLAFGMDTRLIGSGR